MFWKKVNEEMNESEVIVKTLNGVKESFCPKCGLKRPTQSNQFWDRIGSLFDVLNVKFYRFFLFK